MTLSYKPQEGRYQPKSADRKRKHDRRESPSRPIKMANLNSQTFYVLPSDESDGGIGAIYTGHQPPNAASFYSFSDGNKTRHVEVKWVKKIADGLYRLGLQYIKLD